MADLDLILITGNYGRIQIKNYNHLQEQLYAKVTQKHSPIYNLIKFH